MNRDDVVLTDEQTLEARKLGGQLYLVAIKKNLDVPSLDGCCNMAQNLEQLKKVVEWGLGSCAEHFKQAEPALCKFACWACRQELKELAAIE